MENKSAQQLCEQFLSFIETRSPYSITESLRCILLFYWDREKKEGSPCDFHKCLSGIVDLLLLLDAAEEYKNPKPKNDPENSLTTLQ